MKPTDKKEQQSSIQMNGRHYSNITVIDKDQQPVAIITGDELVTLKGYQVLFNVGEA